MKKVIIYICVSALLMLTAATGIVYVYQDEIIKLFVQELNKKLQTKVDVQKIDLSLFDRFPQVALSFQNLTVQGALPKQKQPLAQAEKLYLTFDFWNILGGNYKINEVFLENAYVQVYVNEKGEENYQIFKKSSGSGSAGSQVNFDLEQIFLTNVQVTYTDDKNKGIYNVLANKVASSLQIKEKDLLIKIDGKIVSKFIQLDNYKYFADKDINIDGDLLYNLDKNNLLIKPSIIGVKKSEFLVEGGFENHSSGLIDLIVKGKNTDIQTLVSLLPTQYSEPLSVYKSKGKVYFDSQIKGATFKGAIPLINVQFGCENASFYKVNINKGIENASLSGSFTNGSKHIRATSLLKLHNIKGTLDTKPFAGNFSLTNFDDPYLVFNVKGELDVASLLSFYQLPDINQANGVLAANIAFEGKLTDLRAKAVNRFVQTSGDIDIRDLTFSLKARPLQFQHLQGNFVFDKTDLIVNNLRGKVASSDFVVNGTFKNIMAYLFFRDQNLSIDAQFSSNLLDFDELLAANVLSVQGAAYLVEKDNEGSYQFSISPLLSMNLTCLIDKVKFRRFRAEEIKGNLLVNNQIATTQDIQLATANGKITLDGTINAQQPDKVKVICQAELQQIAIDSIFYMFENFNQDFIVGKHLQGRVNAQIQSSMIFDKGLNMDVPALVADAKTTVINGGLVNFEPMQKLSKFIKRQDLANMQFSEMENNIHIENSTVYIPEMEIRSNVSNLSVKGTHTFDQVMDYKLKVPMYNFMGKRAREVANENSSNLFLKVHGTSDRYTIEYDKEAVKEKLTEDWQKEKQEFKDLLKGKKAEQEKTQPTKPEPEEKEEFFDF